MDGGAVSELRFALLGPVRAWHGEDPLPPGSPQQRALLAALLLRGGRTATADELIDALWGEQPPDSALAALRTYAFRLRKTLGTRALVSEAGGYALRTAPGSVDVSVAERYAAEAEAARGAGDPARSRELLSRALELWEGEPLAGLPGPHADNQRTRFTEWRLSLLETRLELDLELGGHTEVVSELTALSAEYPLRERLRSLLMLALYRGGRQAEALGVYADTRRLLAEELGVDPCLEVSELHQRILEADPDLAGPSATGDHAVTAVLVRPAQLPAIVADFTGRESLVGDLVGKLGGVESPASGGTAAAGSAEYGSGGGPGSAAGGVRGGSPGGAMGSVMALSAVAGIGGVGKTALAVHVAHAARNAFPDGQLYVDLQGQDASPAEPETVLVSFLRALGVPESSIPDGLEDRAALYRSVLDGRRVLALLDNARDAAQIRPLLPGTPGSAALITSRARMVGLEGATMVDLDVMDPAEALQLFTRIAGTHRVMAERQAALDVVAACGYLPLAIRIAGSRLATRRAWTVSFLARKLSDERRRLDELKTGDLAVAATFELGYGQLAVHQARAFRLLALADGPDLSLHAAAAILDMDPDDAEELLEGLVDTSLLESSAPTRYRFHDLIRLYARACAERDETDQARDAASARLLDFYLATAACAYELENPGDRALDHLAPTRHPGLTFDSREVSLEWLYCEAPGLLAAVQRQATATRAAGLRQAVDLLFATQDVFESGIHALVYERGIRAVIDAAADRGDALVEGRARVLLGRLIDWTTSRSVDADQEAERSLALGLAAKDPLTCSYAPNLRGLIAQDHGRSTDALAYYQQAIEAFRADGNERGTLSVLSNLSRIYVELGDVDSAVAAAEESVCGHHKLRSGFRLGSGLYTLGIALTAAGRIDEALPQLTEALAIFREVRQPVWQAATFLRMAEAHLAADGPRQAASCAEQCITLFNEGGGYWQRARALSVLGHALSKIGQPDRARACWHDALAVHPDPQGEEAQKLRCLLNGPSTPPPSAVAV